MAKREKSAPKWYNVALDLLCALIWWISLAAALTRWRRARAGEQT